ncbi:MAG: Exodeoxyribonuclease 7 large subunit [Pseudomonadota bacterium]|jgi:exodeoxyribonuclease VII large subunit
MTRIDSEPRVWSVGALCLAIADTLNARFNPVAVKGEISGFSRAASGHCYFNLKDESGQIRCAMFKRAASALGFMPKDGEMVELRGKLGVYEARGDLQLVVETMQRAGQGDLFAQFLKLKANLEAEGLFDASRKRDIPAQPRAIGVITSLGAAALHDVVSALQRRVPHIPVIVAPASVQGINAPSELLQSLKKLVSWQGQLPQALPNSSPNFSPMPLSIDVILMVRGGGSMEDLWAFNDEALVRAVASCPIPIISGVGHETDFTLTDFVADLRAPTPTAAAELVATEGAQLLADCQLLQKALADALTTHLDRMSQRLDWVANRLGRPSSRLKDQTARLMRMHQSLQYGFKSQVQAQKQMLSRHSDHLPRLLQQNLQLHQQRNLNMGTRLGLLDPHLVLERGYAWLTDDKGRALTHVSDFQANQSVTASLADGQVNLQVK